jgi:DNA repair protein SbcC/Rad50
MKVLKIAGKNLNSLKGEWLVDFTASEYTSEGIFAITGPTGAGKSTILDALSLALFGRTPRLKNITQTTNEIMSRGCGECYAEAEIETTKGRFRFSWSQKRAKSSADGKLQGQKREIAETGSGGILASTISDADKKVVELTGLNYDQFSRSILLAQGDFAAFLKAGENERSEILEQITGTIIYSEISKRAFEKQKEEKEKLAKLEEQISGIEIFSKEKETELKEELESKKKEYAKQDKNQQIYSNIINLIKNIEKTGMELKELEKLIPEKKEWVEKNQKLKEEKQSVFKLAKDDQEKQQALFKKARSFDQSISERNISLKQMEEEFSLNCKLVETKKEELKKEKVNKEKLTAKINGLEKYFEEHLSGEKLVSELSGLAGKVEKFFEDLNKINDINLSLKKFTKNLEDKDRELKQSEKEYGDLQKKQGSIKKECEELKKQLKTLLNGETVASYRKIKEGLIREVSLIKKIEDYESERKKLQSGNPCPLCGSKEHPFAIGNIPQKDEKETEIDRLEKIISKAETIELNLKNKEDSGKETDGKIAAFVEKIEGVKREKKSVESNVSDTKKDIETGSAAAEKAEKLLSNQFEQFKIADASRENFRKHLETLKMKKDEWVFNSKEKEMMTSNLAKIDSKLSGLEAEIKSIEKSTTGLQTKISDAKKGVEEIKKNRMELFGTKNVDDEESKLRVAINNLEKELEKVSETLAKETENLNNDLAKQSFLLKSKGENLSEFEKIKQVLPDETDLEKTSVEELSLKLEAIRAESKNVAEMVGTIGEQLKKNEISKNNAQQKLNEIALQKHELQKWSYLNDLIGSADGKKFRAFAQGLTFEIMVGHANWKLADMTDRYLLKRDTEKPLELLIVDNYKAGEIRSTQNLSGGESFIVSLALALGLSSLSSKKMRIDSLFLDEGFGTLDEDSLNIALNTLAGLHDQGKLIGVISHVQAMKERIATHISIVPVREGNSRIEGPGVVFN